MEIPFGKISVYVLTFLAYVYSVHGLFFLGNLRDAAETVFGLVNYVFDAAVGEECIFKCPGESIRPTPNRYHVPVSNGCLRIDSQYLPISEITNCCNLHDICYGTCNNNKQMCDVEFQRCLYRYCERYKTAMTDTIIKSCKEAANVLITGTLALGCKSYLNAQQQACVCSSYGW